MLVWESEASIKHGERSLRHVDQRMIEKVDHGTKSMAGARPLVANAAQFEKDSPFLQHYVLCWRTMNEKERVKKQEDGLNFYFSHLYCMKRLADKLSVDPNHIALLFKMDAQLQVGQVHLR